MSNCLTYYRYMAVNQNNYQLLIQKLPDWLTMTFSHYCGYCFATDKRLCQLFLAFGIYDCFRSSFCVVLVTPFHWLLFTKGNIKDKPLSFFVYFCCQMTTTIIIILCWLCRFFSFHIEYKPFDSMKRMNNFSLLYTLELKKWIFQNSKWFSFFTCKICRCRYFILSTTVFISSTSYK